MDALVRQGCGFTQKVTSDNPDSLHSMDEMTYSWTEQGLALASGVFAYQGGFRCDWRLAKLVLPARPKKGDQWRQASKRTCKNANGDGGSGTQTEISVVVSLQPWTSSDVGTIPTVTIRRTSDMTYTYSGQMTFTDKSHEERTDVIALEGGFLIQSDITNTYQSGSGEQTIVRKVRLEDVAWA